MRRCFALMMIVGVVAGMFGCSGAQVLEQKSANPFEIDAKEYKRVYEAARLVLEEDLFQLDEQNYRYGIISTKPQASPTLLEPWYTGVNSTWEQVGASSLDAVQRVVTVRVTTGKLLRFELAKQPRYQPNRREDLFPEANDAVYELDFQPGPVPVEEFKLPEDITPDEVDGQMNSDASKGGVYALGLQVEKGQGGVRRGPNGSLMAPERFASPKTIRQIANPKLSVPQSILDLKDDVYYLYVKVDLQRQVNTLRYLNGRLVDDVFAMLNEVPIELRRRGIPANYWETFGQDEFLEQKLLRQIIEASFEQ
ncbi:hypothetical protein KS4_35800 [Poriferisphaera corsica]|uniref:Lipoprotein n=1 Tax=Poriferisphaera corsica TaxID=2528020 RepID=A0A517YZ53_9BACT|nr:hypothetical protein [Poriferisphaera corsica]QDU35497.1 hypothetical protein KS4_35800 [Poriferisphaera corsica]